MKQMPDNQFIIIYPANITKITASLHTNSTIINRLTVIACNTNES